MTATAPRSPGAALRTGLAALVAGVGSVVALTVAAAPMLAAPVPAAPVPAASRPPSCSIVGTAQVGSAYGIKVGPPAQEVKPPVTVCTFTSNTPPVIVLVRVQMGETAKSFRAERQQFVSHGAHTTTRSGFGQMAYSSALGSGKTLISTLVVLKGSTELLVSGTGRLGNAEALARLVLPKL